MPKPKTYETKAIGITAADGKWETITVQRNIVGDDDIEIDIKFCGVCHSDVHVARDELQPFAPTHYPCVPGHELAGIATKVGKNVTNIREGDKVGVGCMVDSCQGCTYCKKGQEMYCLKGATQTYNSALNHGRIHTDKGYTIGGYSDKLTVHQKFAIKIPNTYPLECAGPVFCAGVTTYSPLAYWGAKNGGKRIGVVGIGGLGQMAIRQAKAMGNEVTAISTSPNKESIAREIGASHFVISKDPESMKAATGTLDLIINTVSAEHDAMVYLALLGIEGTLCMLGLTKQPQKVGLLPLVYGRRSVSGSVIGSIKETQECIDFCHKHGIKPAVEFITKDQLPQIYDKLEGKNDSIVRYVLDIKKSMAE